MNHAKRNPGIPKRPNPQKNAKVVLDGGTAIRSGRSRIGFALHVSTVFATPLGEGRDCRHARVEALTTIAWV